MNRTTSYFYSQESFTPCDRYVNKLKSAYDSLWGSNSSTVLPSGVGILLKGAHPTVTPIVDRDPTGKPLRFGAFTCLDIFNAGRVCEDHFLY